MNSFDLLSENIQRKIWEMRWDTFTPVQDQAIPLIMKTDKDIIISSGTASGKTEAAFLPILTQIEESALHSLKVIYISPLKALINNQFERIIDLCSHMEIPIHRWHGDVSTSKKKQFLENPTGILQITPESIESLFVNRTNFLSHIFKDIEFIIIDEIHSFIGSDRGTHLRSLLDRLDKYFFLEPRIIGLSATINNFDVVKKWVRINQPQKVEIIRSKGYDKKLLYSLFYFKKHDGGKIPMELFEDIRNLTKTRKSIIFCNSRASVEELTHILNRLSSKEGRGECYYAHHASLDRKWREYVEKEMNESVLPKSIISTSTLELGIDIGDVDIVIQVDSTFTVSSLKQRLGRSGRKKESNQILQLYATEEDSLIQSLAVMELNLDGWVEPAEIYKKPYDILFHQIISICAESNGLSIERLIEKISRMSVFQNLKIDIIKKLIFYMIEVNILEIITGIGEVIVGLSGEKILRSKDFYSVFESPEELTVYYKAKKIGRLDKNPGLQPGNNIILGGKLWMIKEVNYDKSKVSVNKAVNGDPPIFFSGTSNTHPKIHEKMVEILCDDCTYEYLSQRTKNALADMRKKYHYIKLSTDERPIWIYKDFILFETFAGTIISQTIYWMLKVVDIHATCTDSLGRIKIQRTPNFNQKFKRLVQKDWHVNDILSVVENNELFSSKFTQYLPKELIYEMHIAHKIDLEGALKFLREKAFRFVNLN